MSSAKFSVSGNIADLFNKGWEVVAAQHPLKLALFTFVIGTLGFASFIAFLYWRSTYYPKHLSPLRHIPGPEPQPFFGNFLQISRAQGTAMEIEWTAKYGEKGYFRSTGLFGKDAVTFLRPKALRKILVEEPYLYTKPPFTTKLLGFVAGFGLLTVEGDTHKKMRKMMNPAFALSNLIEQFPIYYDKIYPLVDIMKKEISESGGKAADSFAILDCDAMCQRALLDIICLTAFGYDPDSVHNPESELASAYHTVTSLQTGNNQFGFALLMQIPGITKVLDMLVDYSDWEDMIQRREPGRLRDLFRLLNGMRRIKRVSREILNLQLRSGDRVAMRPGSKAIIDIIEETYLHENEGKAKSLKQAEKDMMTQVLTFLGAGHETTASGVSWTLWNLATHPEKQERLRAECKELMEADPRAPYSAVKSLTYLDAVINETMRLTPPVPRTIRQAEKSDYIDGVWIPKGTLLPISNRAVNTDKRLWGEDAMEFRPERWYDLPEGYDRTFSMLTFIAGAHACIGRTMSYLEMKAVICVLLANFRFEPISKEQNPEMESLITMKPKGGLPLKVFNA